MLCVESAVAAATAMDSMRCFHELFESQVDARPSALAMICGDNSWSYGELERRANQLAQLLRARGIRAGKLVGLLLRRSENSVVAILAVLKAGGAYVPLDPGFPAKRIQHIVDEAEVALLLTENALADKASECFAGPCIVYDRENEELRSQSSDRVSREESGVAPTDLCYVLYTSGSTGRPKGVMTEHRNVTQFADSFNEICQILPSDRVYHGFALGFDGSVEELCMALSNGACLVVGTTEIAQIGNDAAQVFTDKSVTVFSTVPTCLGMIHDDAPTLRLIIVSGEPCPPKLVDKWATQGRRLLNVYGPTETTVNATVADCIPQQPVTIGRPLRGYSTLILSPEMKPVPVGERGELYIGGVGVSRGYLGQPELNEKHFVDIRVNGDDYLSRMYRTGDLVQMGDDGNLLFLGRIDRQVKIRGYRIELSEIEAILREHPAISQAVVNVFERDSRKELAAYVVPRNGSIDRDDVARWVRERTPSYMVPSYLDQLESLPTLASGKVDRKRLPDPSTPLVSTTRAIELPANPIEESIVRAWQGLLKLDAISVEDDFFLDLGGYSLLAAEMASSLRKEHGYDLSLRDVYSHPTCRKLAQHVATSRVPAAQPSLSGDPRRRRSSREVFASVPRLTRWTCVSLQAISAILLFGMARLPLVCCILATIGLFRSVITPSAYVWTLMGVVFVAPPLGILIAVAIKWAIIGRFRPGEYPVWGFYYFRWWLASRVQLLAWTDVYVGSPILNLYYRMMGAKVGRNCVIDTSQCICFDLVRIGDDTCIGAETQLLGYRVEDGMLRIGAIEIGSRCFVGVQSSLGLDVTMGDDAYLDDLSLLADGETMASGESRSGSPAVASEVSVPTIQDHCAASRQPFVFGMLHFIASEVVGEVFLLAAALPMTLIVGHTTMRFGLLWGAAALFAAIPLCLAVFCIVVAGVKAMLQPRSKSGVHPVESWTYLRHWLVDLLLRLSGEFLYSLYTTIYYPIWLRMLGAKIGRRAEISTVTSIVPDLVEIGDESFFADGAIIGARRLFRGHFQVEKSRIGSRSFVGNSAVLPPGAELGNGCLLGVLSIPPKDATLAKADGSEWLGSPPFRLPHRVKVEGFAASTTVRPTLRLYVLRCIIDAGRVLLPFYSRAMLLCLYIVGVVTAFNHLPLWGFFALTPLLGAVLALLSAILVVAVKQILMGEFKPVVKPLWCTYVWVNELVNGYFETTRHSLAIPLLGTPFINWYLRLLGCDIGRWAFIDTDLFSEFDLVHLGDHAAINAGAIIQNHLFEDRVMKSSHLHIGDECNVGGMTVVLYDTVMQRGSTIAPLSLLMKGETLSENTRWMGIPTSQVQ